MPNWKKLIVSGSDAALNSLFVTNAVTASVISSSYIDLDVLENGDIPAHRPGRIFFGQEDGALEVYNEIADIILQVGQENLVRVYNGSGINILNGTPVRVSGSQGDRLKIFPAVAPNHTASYEYENHILGVTTHNINNGSEGYVTNQGIVRGVSTNGFSAGDILFLQTGSPSLPQDYYRNTPPPFPFDIIQVGYVARSASPNGFIYVAPKEPTHFGNISGLSGSANNVGDLWVYQANNAWTPTKILSGSYTLSGSIASTAGFTGSLQGTATTASFVTSSNVYGPFGSNSVFYAVSASWAPSSGAGGAAGSEGDIQFNQGGVLGGNGSFNIDSSLNFNHGSDNLMIGELNKAFGESNSITGSGNTARGFGHRIGSYGYFGLGGDNTFIVLDSIHGDVSGLYDTERISVVSITDSGSISFFQDYIVSSSYEDPSTVLYVNNTIPAGVYIINIDGVAEPVNSEFTTVASHAEGAINSITTFGSHGEGGGNSVRGIYSHAEGILNTTYGIGSHAEGSYNRTGTTRAYFATIEDGVVTLSSTYGDQTSAFSAGSGLYINDRDYDNVIGVGVSIIQDVTWDSSNTIITLDNPGLSTSFALVGDVQNFSGWGGDMILRGDYSHVEGFENTTIGRNSHAEGETTVTFGDRSHTEGISTIAIGAYSHAEGTATIAGAESSHAEGNSNITLGDYSHAEGGSNITFGSVSHAEGENNQALGEASHAEGYSTITTGYASHAEGEGTQTLGDASHAEGYGTITTENYQHATGQWNQPVDQLAAFIIGNGVDDDNRSNLLVAVDNSVQITGSLIVTGSVYAIGLSDTSQTNVVTYDSTTGQLFYTASSAIGGGGGGGGDTTAIEAQVWFLI